MPQRVILITAAWAAAASSPPAASITWSTALLHSLSPTFISLNIDTASLDARMDVTDPVLINLISQLGHVWLRIGGTSANSLVYDPSGPAGDLNGAFHLNDAYWADIATLQRATGASILFGLPRQVNASGVYDPRINATALWAATVAFKFNVTAWSVGNELIGPGFDVQQYADDYATLVQALRAFPDVGQAVFGPSAAGYPGAPLLSPFMTGTAALLTGFTFHAYAFKNCSLDVYVAKQGIERMQYYLTSYAALRDAVAPGLPLVLEEAATQAGGGCEGLSDRFVSGFWWLHSLGLAAEAGIARVHRQDVAGFSFNGRASHYMLAGAAGWINASVSGPLTPHPDWFATLLHKQTADVGVLGVTLVTDPVTNASLAVHAWCTAAVMGAPSGAITLSYLNLNVEDVSLSVPTGTAVPRVEYMMTGGGSNGSSSDVHAASASPPASLTSDTVNLNGIAMSVGPDGMLPAYPVPGARVTAGDVITLPAWSYGFVVLEAAGVAACVGG